MSLADHVNAIRALAREGKSEVEIAAATGLEIGDVATVLAAGVPGAEVSGSSAGSPVVRKFPFAFDTPGLLTGHPVYTPAVGDILLDAWFDIVTPWDTPTAADIRVVDAGVGSFGWYVQAVDMTRMDQPVPPGFRSPQNPSLLLWSALALVVNAVGASGFSTFYECSAQLTSAALLTGGRIDNVVLTAENGRHGNGSCSCAPVTLAPSDGFGVVVQAPNFASGSLTAAVQIAVCSLDGAQKLVLINTDYPMVSGTGAPVDFAVGTWEVLEHVGSDLAIGADTSLIVSAAGGQFIAALDVNFQGSQMPMLSYALQVSSPVVFGGGPGLATFDVAEPVELIVNTTGESGGVDPGATQGEAILYLVTATPV